MIQGHHGPLVIMYKQNFIQTHSFRGKKYRAMQIKILLRMTLSIFLSNIFFFMKMKAFQDSSMRQTNFDGSSAENIVWKGQFAHDKHLLLLLQSLLPYFEVTNFFNKGLTRVFKSCLFNNLNIIIHLKTN